MLPKYAEEQSGEKLVSFMDYVGRAVSSKKIAHKDIAMDETAVWFDMVSPTTIDNTGKVNSNVTLRYPCISLNKNAL